MSGTYTFKHLFESKGYKIWNKTYLPSPYLNRKGTRPKATFLNEKPLWKPPTHVKKGAGGESYHLTVGTPSTLVPWWRS